MNITVEVIPHDKQRYPTCGDWFYEPNGEDLVIRVSKLSDWRYEALVQVHELVEVLVCKQNKVSQQKVDEFDMTFEKDREARLERALDNLPEGPAEAALIRIEEPGDSPDAPYRGEHCFATGIERLLASALGVCWADYEKEIESLP